MGAQCEVVVEKGMPPLENAEDICTQLAESSRKVLGADCVVQDLTPSMGSDDFSCMLEAVSYTHLDVYKRQSVV